MSSTDNAANMPTETTLSNLVQNGPITGDPSVLDPVLYDGVDVDDPDDNAIGVVFSTEDDEKKFFEKFVRVGEDGVRTPIEGTKLNIEKEKGSEDCEVLMTVYDFKSIMVGIPNDVCSFIGKKYADVSLDSKWVKLLVLQEDYDPESQDFRREFIRSLYRR
jgi:hypothetical protein